MRFVWLLQVVLILFTPSVVYAYRHRGDPPRAATGAGLIAAGMYVALFGLVLAGEILTDPGGGTGAGLVASWLVPMILLSLLAWLRPDPARLVLAILVVAMAALYAWSAWDPDAWGALQDDTGPVLGIMAFALTAPLALLAVRYVRDAGVLLLSLGAMPVVVLVVLRITDAGWGPWSWALLDVPPLIIGTLFLVASRLDDRIGTDRVRRPASPSLPSSGGPPTTV